MFKEKRKKWQRRQTDGYYDLGTESADSVTMPFSPKKKKYIAKKNSHLREGL